MAYLMRCFLFFYLISFSAASAALDRILILSSGDSKPYIQTLKAYKNLLQQKYPAIRQDVYIFSIDELRAIEGKEYRLAIALGKQSVAVLKQAYPDLPVIAALISNREVLAGYKNITGIDLHYTPEQQLEALAYLLPEYKRYGLLYSPATADKAKALQQLAKSYQIELYLQEVTNPRYLLDAIDKMLSQVDLVWGVADPLLLTPQTAKVLLLSTYREKIPLIASSPGWARAGALLASDWSYDYIAQLCFQLTEDILQGKTIDQLPWLNLEQYYFSANKNTIKWIRLNAESKQKLLDKAVVIYE